MPLTDQQHLAKFCSPFMSMMIQRCDCDDLNDALIIAGSFLAAAAAVTHTNNQKYIDIAAQAIVILYTCKENPTSSLVELERSI